MRKMLIAALILRVLTAEAIAQTPPRACAVAYPPACEVIDFSVELPPQNIALYGYVQLHCRFGTGRRYIYTTNLDPHMSKGMQGQNSFIELIPVVISGVEMSCDSSTIRIWQDHRADRDEILQRLEERKNKTLKPD